MKRSILVVTVLMACQAAPPEHYAFVTTLGRDTVAAENVSKSGRRLVADGVDRWPFVRMRHSEFDLDGSGKLRHMVMQVQTPNGDTPAHRGRTVTADFSGDRVRISVRDSAGVRDTAFNTGGAITVPHVSMMYSVIEQEIAAALRQRGASAIDTIPFRQFYPDRDVGRSFALHHGIVRPQGNGKVELTHDWLSGAGDVVVDSAGRMLSYDGSRSTYQVKVARVAPIPDLGPLIQRMTADEQRTGPRQLSVRDTTRATIGAATFLVDYSRPLVRGRTLLGEVIPYGYVWRTGANAATQFTTSQPIVLAGLQLAAGTYTLWTVPRKDRVEFIVNTQTGQWGTGYDHSKDLGHAVMNTETRADTVEAFTIAIEPVDARRGTLALSWGNLPMDGTHRGEVSRSRSALMRTSSGRAARGCPLARRGGDARTVRARPDLGGTGRSPWPPGQ
ncbi:MAG: DUF2911 domain-containing protein [Gemmatimonadaceae bacterium]